MSSLVMNFHKGQRMDITAQMKDADKILEAFRTYNIRFEKKYTTINNDSPSTITFKGLKAENVHSNLTDLIVCLHESASEGAIDNVYLKITGFVPQKKKAPADEDGMKELQYSTL